MFLFLWCYVFKVLYFFKVNSAVLYFLENFECCLLLNSQFTHQSAGVTFSVSAVCFFQTDKDLASHYCSIYWKLNKYINKL